MPKFPLTFFFVVASLDILLASPIFPGGLPRDF